MNAEEDVSDWGKGFLVMIDHKGALKEVRKTTKDESVLRWELSKFIKMGTHSNNLKSSSAGLIIVHEQQKKQLCLE